jgi:hypothetical protein
MSAPSTPLTGDPLLEAVIHATVERHEAPLPPRAGDGDDPMRCGALPAARPNTPPLKET